MTTLAGVYEIRNIVNDNCYIGSSINIDNRWRYHKNKLRKGAHCNPHLQRAWNLYGEENFVFGVLIICDRDNTLFYEQKFLNKLQPEYNIALDATAPMKGRRQSEEAKRKMSKALSGENNPMFGKHRSEETKRKISAASGYSLSEETKQKMSRAEKKYWARKRQETLLIS